MATIQGTGGAVALVSGFNVKAETWSMDIAVEATDTTGLSDAGYRTREGTLVDSSGTVTGYLEGGSSTPVAAALVAATADPDSAKGTVTFTAEAGNTLSVSALITSVSISRPTSERATVNLTWVQAAGPITQTWA
jgi:hypothetical protein